MSWISQADAVFPIGFNPQRAPLIHPQRRREAREVASCDWIGGLRCSNQWSGQLLILTE